MRAVCFAKARGLEPSEQLVSDQWRCHASTMREESSRTGMFPFQFFSRESRAGRTAGRTELGEKNNYFLAEISPKSISSSLVNRVVISDFWQKH